MKYSELFEGTKPLIGMIHTKGTPECEVLDLAKKEIEIYLKNGIYPLIENYFGSKSDCEIVLDWLQREHPDAVYGINILGDYRAAFHLAAKYGAKFIQIDSVSGHLLPSEDKRFAESLRKARQICDVVLLGGVRFKYQPVLSGRTLEEDMKIGMERCDCIVCTGEGTGKATPMGKVLEFKSLSGEFPVIVGAGVTIDTVEETFAVADGAIVGSWLKDNHRDFGVVSESNVGRMMSKIV